MPWLRVLVLAVALLHATGAADAIEVRCDDACADTDCGDDGCAPICPTCQCAPCPTGLTAPIVGEVVPAARRPSAASFPVADETMNNPDPREILHVPIAPGV